MTTSSTINPQAISDWLTVPSPAKLNLMLHITGQREDGYHELQTIFQFVDYGDELSFQLRNDNEITLSPEIEGVNFEDNLIIKGARALQNHKNAANKICGANIQLKKILPMGGGLGGGSSNAAVTMLALNKLLTLGYSIDEMALMGASLGADVPVFVRGHSAWGEGIGEELCPIDLPNRWFVIIYPDCHVSTQQIFSAPELTRNTPPITVSAVFDGSARNDLQPVVVSKFEQVKTALDWLSGFGPAMMTGSGACVFAGFDSQDEAQRVAQRARDTFEVFVAKGINRFTAV